MPTLSTDLTLEAATMRRVSWRLMPFLLAAYLICYIDRVNVGFAALQMNKAVGIDPKTYGLGAGIFGDGAQGFGEMLEDAEEFVEDRFFLQEGEESKEDLVSLREVVEQNAWDIRPTQRSDFVGLRCPELGKRQSKFVRVLYRSFELKAGTVDGKTVCSRHPC